MFRYVVPLPPISLSFILANVLPRWKILRVISGPLRLIHRTFYKPNFHRSLCRLAGCQILVENYTSVLVASITYYNPPPLLPQDLSRINPYHMYLLGVFWGSLSNSNMS